MTASLRPLHDPAAEPMERGVYRIAKLVRGQATYFSVTSAGAVLETRTIPKGKLSEATALVELWNALDTTDALRPVLTLIRPTPGCASDPTFHLRLRPLRPRLRPDACRPL